MYMKTFLPLFIVPQLFSCHLITILKQMQTVDAGKELKNRKWIHKWVRVHTGVGPQIQKSRSSVSIRVTELPRCNSHHAGGSCFASQVRCHEDKGHAHAHQALTGSDHQVAFHEVHLGRPDVDLPPHRRHVHLSSHV